VPGLSSTTAAGLARQMTSDQWRAVETGLAVVTERLVGMLPAAQTEGPVIGGLVASRIVTRQRERLAIILGLLFFGVFVAPIGLSPVFYRNSLSCVPLCLQRFFRNMRLLMRLSASVQS
jgi:hypothetical protein